MISFIRYSGWRRSDMAQEFHTFGGYQAFQSPAKVSFSGVEPSIESSPTLGRIYQSVACFAVLTRHLRAVVDERLAPHLTVTGWQNGELRVHLDQPAFATRWRFQEPLVRRAMLQKAGLSSLREIRLVMTDVGGRRPAPGRPERPPPPSALLQAPLAVLQEMAALEEHPALRKALLALSDAAAKAQARV